IGGSITFGASYGFAFGLGLRYRERRVFVAGVGALLGFGPCRGCARDSYEQPGVGGFVVGFPAPAGGVAPVARRGCQTRPTSQVAIAPTWFDSGGGLVAFGEF